MKRQGFTLVEILVVLAIIATLIALLLPAIQKIRAAAGATLCSNNLRQLTLATIGYEVDNRRFPVGGKGYGFCASTLNGTGDKKIYNLNGLVHILPYIEQSPIHDALDFNIAFHDATSPPAGAMSPPANLVGNQNGNLVGNDNHNRQITSNKIKTFFCPLDNISNESKINYDFSVNLGDTGDGVNGTNKCNCWSNTAINTRRVFGENSRTAMLDLRDGASNTILMSETLTPLQYGYRAWHQVGVDVHNGFNSQWYSPGSKHNNGCYMGFGDGSVKFISNTIEINLLRKMSRIADE